MFTYAIFELGTQRFIQFVYVDFDRDFIARQVAERLLGIPAWKLTAEKA